MRSDWFQARRLDGIDALLATRGELRRQDIMDLFGVSLPQASMDIQAFVREHPGAIRYDLSSKRYVPAGPKYRRQRSLPDQVRETLRLIQSPSGSKLAGAAKVKDAD